MKKIVKIGAKIILLLLALILAAMILIPILFKNQIKEVVVTQVNEMVNARVDIGDFSLGFFKNFPNLAFSLKDVSVSGVDQFAGDTLAAFNSFSVVFNLKSIFSDDGYEVKSIIVDQPRVKAVVLADGSANWDIMKESEEAVEEVVAETPAEPSGEMKLLLRRFLINNGTIIYNDASLNMSAVMEGLNFTLSGDMTESETDLLMALNLSSVDVVYDGIRYLRRASVDSEIGLFADLNAFRFVFSENYFTINDLTLNFAGEVVMPEDDIYTDITFSTPKTNFKSLISMVPAIYLEGYEALRADGSFELSGNVKGTYSDADSTMPDAVIKMAVRDGLISYPDLPEKITAIKMDMNVDFNGTDMDKTVVDLSEFHFELAGNPFDLTMLLKTPMSDPDIKASASGKIDFGSLANAIPIEDMTLTGILETSLDMAGRMSMIEEERYQDFHAAGRMALSGFKVTMTDMPEVTISKAAFTFNPEFAELTDCNILVGKNSDFRLDGKLANYIPYVFSDGTIRGSLDLYSAMVDADEIMASMGEDTEPEDTTALALIVVPANIDFTFNALIDKLNYGTIKPTEIKGKMVVRDGMLQVSDAGMNIVGGKMLMNALYDTRDSLKPLMSADLAATDILVKEAFETFNTVQKLAPAAKGIDGAISMTINFSSLLASDMMPVINSINGEGVITSNELQFVDSPTFKKIGDVLKLGDKYTNTFKDIRVSFRVKDGRVYVTPFDTKMGNIKMNISGDQGFDQTLNYFIKTEIPRATLGSAANELVDNLASQASRLGMTYTPSDVIKVNLKVGGTATKPDISPDFGGTGTGVSSTVSALKEQAKEEVKEAVKEVVTDIADKGRAEAEAQAAKIMQEAEEKAQAIRDEAAKAAEKLKGEAELQAQRLIKEAEGKNAIAKAAAARGADVLRREADKKAVQLVSEADVQAQKLLDEAAAKKEALLKKI
jgi:hypothetical protein